MSKPESNAGVKPGQLATSDWLGRSVRKLGSGWKWLGSSVWEHPNGTRIHCLGRARWPDGSTRCWTWQEEYAFKRLMGGSTKRALMAWALSLLPNTKAQERA